MLKTANSCAQPSLKVACVNVSFCPPVPPSTQGESLAEE